jgi:hypothetical protein
VPIKKKAPAKPVRPAKTARFGAGLFDDVEEDDQPTPAPATIEAAPVAAEPARTRPAKAEPTYEKAADAEPVDATPAEKVDEYGRPEPQANYVVHVYELGRFKRTIDRDFTPEAAEAFATEYNRTAKRYGRKSLAGKKDTQPAKELA